jgi:hypothetical protein
MARLIMWNLTTLWLCPPLRSGKRAKLKLLDAKTLSTGIVILRYAPA